MRITQTTHGLQGLGSQWLGNDMRFSLNTVNAATRLQGIVCNVQTHMTSFNANVQPVSKAWNILSRLFL